MAPLGRRWIAYVKKLYGNQASIEYFTLSSETLRKDGAAVEGLFLNQSINQSIDQSINQFQFFKDGDAIS